MEEFGKLLLLKDCKKVDGKYIIKYKNRICLLIAETEARLGIFYVDFFDLQNNKNKYNIMKIPNINENKLKDAINELENVVNNFEL